MTACIRVLVHYLKFCSMSPNHYMHETTCVKKNVPSFDQMYKGEYWLFGLIILYIHNETDLELSIETGAYMFNNLNQQ